MQKNYTSLGLMSGTSGDGVDASIINSNGIDEFEVIKDKYYEYDSNIYKNIHSLKEKIFNLSDLEKYSSIGVIKNEPKFDENKLSYFQKRISEIKQSSNWKRQDLVHLFKKKIIFNFRENDIINGGEGAPLTPIYHQLITNQKKISLPVCILNIGGISNITIVRKSKGPLEMFSKDIGPGNCLIDKWVRKNSSLKFDIGGKLASIGNRNEIIFEQAQELGIKFTGTYENTPSLHEKDD